MGTSFFECLSPCKSSLRVSEISSWVLLKDELFGSFNRSEDGRSTCAGHAHKELSGARVSGVNLAIKLPRRLFCPATLKSFKSHEYGRAKSTCKKWLNWKPSDYSNHIFEENEKDH